MDAAFTALSERGVDLLVHYRARRADAPFEGHDGDAPFPVRTWVGEPDTDAMTREITAFDPDAVIICSWAIGGYRHVARRLGGRTLRILTMDNQWRGTLKQRAAVVGSRFVLHPAYDAVLLAGEPQARFARRLGFGEEDLIWGLYTCDHPRFASVAEQRGGAPLPRAFLYVGRLVPEKAVDVLAEAYGRYRDLVTDPWPLIVAGAGPDEHLLRDRDGVDFRGFTQPSELPRLFSEAGCLVLPSRFEPWGVVIHEATAAGLPVVCTSSCGASTRLVLDGYNGHVVGADDPSGLARAMAQISQTDPGLLTAMSDASSSLARQYTPRRWASNVMARIPQLRSDIGLTPAPWMTVEGDLSAGRG